MEMAIAYLWERNYVEGSWVSFLHDEFVKGGLGKDFDTIKHWIAAFRNGETTTITVAACGKVADGNHRLVAAKIAGLEEIGVEVWNSDACAHLPDEFP